MSDWQAASQTRKFAGKAAHAAAATAAHVVASPWRPSIAWPVAPHSSLLTLHSPVEPCHHTRR
eukprot:364201-Chlamydomonas_euryale.AAC.11